MDAGIWTSIERAPDQAALFALMGEYFRGQGFGGVCYVTPAGLTGPYVLMEQGMPPDWIARYLAHSLDRYDPIPGSVFRHGRAARLSRVVENLPSLSIDEQAFIAAFKNSGLSDGLAIPAFGPFGRAGFIGLGQIAHPQLLDQINTPLAVAVAHQFHNRMETLRPPPHLPQLSPREREIVSWIARGKSNNDIAAILGIATPTVATHLKRIFDKLGVVDRVTCVAKSLALHIV